MKEYINLLFKVGIGFNGKYDFSQALNITNNVIESLF